MKLTFSCIKLAKSSEKFLDSQKNVLFLFWFSLARALTNAYAHLRLEQGKQTLRARRPAKAKCKQNKLSFTQNFLDILSLKLCKENSVFWRKKSRNKKERKRIWCRCRLLSTIYRTADIILLRFVSPMNQKTAMGKGKPEAK